MDKKIALLVVYNHRYDKNIKRVENIYKNRFSNIYHIVPFYDGKIDGVNIIPVYENSYYFQSYISQAYTHLSKFGFSHFLIIADDLIINPEVNENNIWDKVGINDDDCFIPSRLIEFQKIEGFWPHLWDAMSYKKEQRGVEVENVLPSKEKAVDIFCEFGLSTEKIPLSALFHGKLILNLYMALKYFPWCRNLKYPLVGCYSDTFFVTNRVMDRFCTYCGAFAATKLFVEVAVPTALILSSEKDKIKFDSDLKLHDGALWPDTIHELDKYEFNLQNLLDNFPNDKFFIHPVKLSKWK